MVGYSILEMFFSVFLCSPCRAPHQNEQLFHPSRETETLKLSKLLNRALCFGNFLILVRDWGRQAESCGGSVPACHLFPSEMSCRQGGMVRSPRPLLYTH